MQPASVFALLALSALAAPAPRGPETPMDRPKEAWFQLAVGERGDPDYRHSDAHTRAQREVLRQINRYHTRDDVDELERVMDAALADAPPADGRKHGVSQGGAIGFDFFKEDEDLIVWFDFDDELVGDARYLSPQGSLLLPMREAVPLFRAWIASVRHWRALEERHGFPVPSDKWPTAYPPPAAN